jgi:hypothetical protein
LKESEKLLIRVVNGTLVELFLPSVITILFIPFLYSLALYIAYENYFIALDCMTVKTEKVKEVKKYILRTANFNLNKIRNIEKNFHKRVFYDDTDLKSYVKTISEAL